MKNYEIPSVEVINLSLEDIVTTSSGGGRNPIETEEDIF